MAEKSNLDALRSGDLSAFLQNEEPPEIKEQPKIEQWKAFMFLFAISFGPAFVAVDLSSDQPEREEVFIMILVVVVLTFISNQVAIWMLTVVNDTKKLGSFQEVAYSISKGNRGYIFLISAMKTAYLVTTAAYCLSFCANYLCSILLQVFDFHPFTKDEDPWQQEHPEAHIHKGWKVWSIYVASIVPFAVATFFIYRSSMIYQDFQWVANLVPIFLLTNLVLMIFFIIPWNDTYYHMPPEEKGFMYDQLQKNGFYEPDSELPTVSQPHVFEAEPPSANSFESPLQVSLGYAPTLAFCNMFCLFYLEITSSTKLTSTKRQNDMRMASLINVAITIFYILLFSMILSFENNVNDTHIGCQLGFLKNWFMMQNPYGGQKKTDWTIFDISQVLLCCILFCHQVMILFVARESILIFVDEKLSQSLSQMLDRINLGVDATGFLTAKSQDKDGGDLRATETGKEEPSISEIRPPMPVTMNTSGALSDAANTSNAKKEILVYRMTYMKLNDDIQKKYSCGLFAIVIFFSLLNLPMNNVVRGMWGVVGSIVCPMMVTVLPGCFFYYIQKDYYPEKTCTRYLGALYALLGLILLPIYLTLSTKNLFTQDQAGQ